MTEAKLRALETWEDAARAATDDLPATEPTVRYRPILDEVEGFVDCIKERGNGDGYLFHYIAQDALVEFCKNNGGPTIDRDFAVDVLLTTLASKQHDYGHDNILWGGVDGVLLRMHDKIARIKNLQSRAAGPDITDVMAHHESLGDSWLDIAGYAIIGIMLTAGTFTLPLRADLPAVAIPEHCTVEHGEQWDTVTITTATDNKVEVTTDKFIEGVRVATCGNGQNPKEAYGPWLNEEELLSLCQLLLGAGCQTFGWVDAAIDIAVLADVAEEVA